MFRKIVLGVGILLCWISGVHAQTVTRICVQTTNGLGLSPGCYDVSPANPLPVQVVPGTVAAAVVATDRGGTLTTGGTAQTIAAANTLRKALIVQNPCSATEDLYVNLGSAATVAGNGNYADLAACMSVSLSPATGAISQASVSVIAATTAHAWNAKEFQ